MKIYETSTAPNARRVRIFLAEKGILDKVVFEQVDIQAGDNIQANFIKKNPLAKIPVLEFDNGDFLSESVAICRYFEALYPEVRLMGDTPLQQANIEMWQRRCEIYFLNLVGMGFQHSTGYFKDRMTPNAQWGMDCIKQANAFYAILEEQLALNPFVAGDAYSIADITALVAVDFARVIKLKIPKEMKNLNKWYESMCLRDSISV